MRYRNPGHLTRRQLLETAAVATAGVGLGTNGYGVDSAEEMAPLREILELMPIYIRFREEGRLRYIDMSTSTDTRYQEQLLLKYVVSHPAVNVAIPGTTKVRHLRDNQAAGRGRLPDAAMRRQIEALWDSLPE